MKKAATRAARAPKATAARRSAPANQEAAALREQLMTAREMAREIRHDLDLQLARLEAEGDGFRKGIALGVFIALLVSAIAVLAS